MGAGVAVWVRAGVAVRYDVWEAVPAAMRATKHRTAADYFCL